MLGHKEEDALGLLIIVFGVINKSWQFVCLWCTLAGSRTKAEITAAVESSLNNTARYIHYNPTVHSYGKPEVISCESHWMQRNQILSMFLYELPHPVFVL